MKLYFRYINECTFFLIFSMLICNCTFFSDLTVKLKTSISPCNTMMPFESHHGSNTNDCDVCPQQQEKFNIFENLVIQTNFYFYDLLSLNTLLLTYNSSIIYNFKSPPPLDKIKFNC